MIVITQLAKSILHPSAVEDLRCHKLKRLVPRPNSYFMDIKCPGIQFNLIDAKLK